MITILKTLIKICFILVLFIASSIYINAEININLKNKCEELGKKYGDFAMIITNPQTGEIREIYNSDMIYYKAFCPGSLLKSFVLISLSKKQNIDPNFKVNCIGYTDGEISCWLGKGHGELNLLEAFAHSCNFYFFHLIKERLDKYDYIKTLNDFDIIEDDAVLKKNL